MATTNAATKSGTAKTNGAQKQRPVWSKGFPVMAAVFEFPKEDGDGPPNFSIKLNRSFRRDEESDWENSEYLGGSDLLRAAKLLEEADAFVQSRLEAYYRSRKSE
jgi:hypothetical protein